MLFQLGNPSVEAEFIGARADEHTIKGGVAIIGQMFELVSGGETEELALVQQDTAEEATRFRAWLERRVETTTGLAVAGASGR